MWCDVIKHPMPIPIHIPYYTNTTPNHVVLAQAISHHAKMLYTNVWHLWMFPTFHRFTPSNRSNTLTHLTHPPTQIHTQLKTVDQTIPKYAAFVSKVHVCGVHDKRECNNMHIHICFQFCLLVYWYMNRTKGKCLNGFLKKCSVMSLTDAIVASKMAYRTKS